MSLCILTRLIEACPGGRLHSFLLSSVPYFIYVCYHLHCVLSSHLEKFPFFPKILISGVFIFLSVSLKLSIY